MPPAQYQRMFVDNGLMHESFQVLDAVEEQLESDPSCHTHLQHLFHPCVVCSCAVRKYARPK